ncbi:cof-like hydrolase [Firmicutes bacterium M10-2]|nr:cof-like hydrolase [Firmicutes bacterium M10-2]
MKLLASDYDGTLHYGGAIMEDDLDAIRKWKKDGNLFVLATGRSLQSIKEQIKKFDIPCDYLITNNGGMVFDAKDNEMMANYLDYITAIDIIYVAKELENVASYVVNDGKVRHKIVVDPTVTDHRYPTLEPDMSEEELLNSGKFAQLVLSMSSNEEALAMAEQINHFFGSTITAYTNNSVVDIVPKGVSKSSGLDFVMAFAKVNDEDVFVIGDSYNDIPMLEEKENSYAMAMAPEEVQAQAKEVVDSIHTLIETIS